MKRYLPLILAVLAALMMIAAGLGTRAGFWHFRTGFELLKWSAYLGVATVLVSIVALLVPAMRARHVTPLVVALLIGAIVFYLPWSWQRKARGVPPIHDIATDTERPPEFVVVKAAEYGGDSIAVQQKAAYPDVRPVMLELAPARAFERAHEAARDMGWEIAAADAAAGRIEATATTMWFGFKDDVAIRVEPAGSGSRVDVRSVSRVGKGDVGANAARIRKYVKELTDD